MTPPEGGKDCMSPPPPPAETREPSDPATVQSCGARHLIVTLAFTTSCCLSGVVFGCDRDREDAGLGDESGIIVDNGLRPG